MACRQINFSLSNISRVNGVNYTMLDEFGNYVFYDIPGASLSIADGLTFSVGSTTSNFTLYSYTQSGSWTECNTGIPNYDTNANSFIVAASITSQSIINPVHKLVYDLKTNNLWNSLLAIYPFVGGSSFSHQFNLKDPRDADAAYRLTYNGGITHNSTGVLGDGSSGWMQTYFTPSTNLSGLTNSISLSYYSRTLHTSSNEMIFSAGTPNRAFFYLQFGTTALLDLYTIGGAGRATSNSVGTLGYFIGTRISNNDNRIYWNGTQSGSTATGDNAAPPAQSIQMLRQNNSTLYTNCECSFAHIGFGLTSGDVSRLNTIVNTFQTSLGRNVY